MEIRIRQTGGFAGEMDLGSVETSRLGERGRRIERLVTALQSRSTPRGASVGADLPRYRITVVGDGAERTLELADEGGEDDVVRRLLAEIQGVG